MNSCNRFLSLAICLALLCPTSRATTQANEVQASQVAHGLNRAFFLVMAFGQPKKNRTEAEVKQYLAIQTTCERIERESLCMATDNLCIWKNEKCELDDDLADYEIRLGNVYKFGFFFVSLGVAGVFLAGAGLPLLAFGTYMLYGAPTASQLKSEKIEKSPSNAKQIGTT